MKKGNNVVPCSVDLGNIMSVSKTHRNMHIYILKNQFDKLNESDVF